MALEFFKRIFNADKVSIELDDIQSILLRNRPIPYVGTLAVFEIKNAETGKKLIKEILPLVTSSEDWHKNDGASVTIVFTYEGLKVLELPQDSLDSFPESFKQGMAARKEKLNDIGENDPKHWEKGYGSGKIHVAAAVIAKDKDEWQKTFSELKQKLDEAKDGITVLETHDFGADEEVKNVFGFRDGIANPEIDGSGIDNPPTFGKPIKAGEFILGYEGEAGVVKPFPQPEVLGKNGSFMVVRKYQSQVAEFNKFIQENTNSPEEGELLAAKMVGRWRSGAPLTLAPENDEKELGENPEKLDDFSYKNDELGKKCPFSSHIRRMNPRDSKSFILEDVRLHRIMRRAVTFGDVVPPEITKNDGKERGQYFIGMSADAMGTTEFLLKQWANDGNSMNLGEEKDPLLGVQKDGQFTKPADPLVKRYHGLQTYNIVKGGEYCFIPSLSALKWISEL